MGRTANVVRSGAGGVTAALLVFVGASGCTRPGDADEAPVDHAHMHHAETGGEPQAGGNKEVQLRPGLVQLLNIRTEPVASGTLPSELRVFGTTTYDAHLVTPVFAPVAGWVDKLAVRGVGERVRAGSTLLEIYSPNLATVDAQLLEAVAGGAKPLDNPYARGLRSLGVTDELILDVVEKRRPAGRIPVRARATGIVSKLDVRVGELFAQGAPALQIASLDSVWVTAYVPAPHASLAEVGTEARITSASSPGHEWRARVEQASAELDPETRTLPVRLVIQNEAETLRANVPVSVTFAHAEAEAVTHVPRDAVIRDGREERIIVALGEGRFAARTVRTGRTSGERTVVLEGVRPGENVVVAGQFLIDSESNLRSALARLSAEDEHAHHGNH